MASLKDKLKSKINKQKNEPETMECFDETSLNVDLIQGKSQLSQLKVCSSWTNKTNMKLPKFKCKWYNRTENNYQEIIGIEEEVYQPSVLDVDSIVEVTCIPELPGVNYEGMPFLLKSKPIVLSPETQAEANRMMDLGKARLIISIKSAKIKGVAVAPASEGMLLIQKEKLTLSEMKFGQINDQILKVVNLQQSTPQIILNRKMARQVTLKFNQEQSCTLYLKNHEVRDAFYLFFQLYNARKIIEKQEKMNQIQIIEQQVVETALKVQEKKQETPLKPIIQIEEVTSKEEQKQIKTQIINGQTTKQTKQKVQEPPKIEENKQPKVEQMKQIKILQSPKKDTITKQNTSDLLQLMKLKDQIKRLEQDNLKLTKDCELEKNKVLDLEAKIEQLNERLNNASMNYFLLEKQVQGKQQIIDNLNKDIEKTKNIQNSKLEEIIYYQNEIKLLKEQNNVLRQSTANLSKECETLKASVAQYQQKYLNKNNPFSYRQLYEQLTQSKQAQKQLKLKYQFQIQEKQKIEQNLRNSRNLIEQIQSQKKCIEKKYESLTNELTSTNMSPSLVSRYSQKLSEKSPEGSLCGSIVFEQMPKMQKIESFAKKNSSDCDFREKEILDLKKQIKDYVQQNNLLRQVIQKEKKSTSRAHLKVELIDAKKIVSRLSQTLGEKEMQISQLKEINRELNKKNKKLQQNLQSMVVSSGKS